MPDLLPPNASALERAIDRSADARFADFPRPIGDLWNPATCPVEILPWLGWALSIDRWDADWSEAEKRAQIAQAIPLQRRKGTPASIDAILASFDALLTLTEWHEQQPPGAPHTFEITLPIGLGGGTRSSAAFVEAIIRDVSRAKPARSHFLLLQSITASGGIGIVVAGRTANALRLDGVGAADTSRPWATFLQTEAGEPIEAEAGDFIEDEAA